MTIFITTLKRIFRQPINWLFIIMFPIVCFFLIGAATTDPEVNVGDTGLFIGIVDQDGSELSQTLVGQLDSRYTVGLGYTFF